jgi:hypothetical protein
VSTPLPKSGGTVELPEGWKCDENVDKNGNNPWCAINVEGVSGVHIRWQVQTVRGVNPQAWTDEWIEHHKSPDRDTRRFFVAVAVHPTGSTGFSYVDIKEEGGQHALAQAGFLWLDGEEAEKRRLLSVVLMTNDVVKWPLGKLRQIAERAPFR